MNVPETNALPLSVAERLALSDLVHRYAADVDDRDFEAVAELFTVDAELAVPDPPATLEPSNLHRGRTRIAAAVAAVAAVERTEHAIVGEVFAAGAESGVAFGRITCVAHHWRRCDDRIGGLVWHIRYRDEYRLVENSWRIQRRSLILNGIETRDMRRIRPARPADGDDGAPNGPPNGPPNGSTPAPG